MCRIKNLRHTKGNVKSFNALLLGLRQYSFQITDITLFRIPIKRFMVKKMISISRTELNKKLFENFSVNKEEATSFPTQGIVEIMYKLYKEDMKGN